jgi:hypothetical protein
MDTQLLSQYSAFSQRSATDDKAKTNSNYRTEAKTFILYLLPRDRHHAQDFTHTLDQLFYFALLYYRNLGPAHPIEWPMVRMPHGPEIYLKSKLLQELVEEQKVQCQSVRVGPLTRTRYLATVKGCEKNPISLDQNCAVAEARNFLANCPSPAEVIRQYSRAWQNGLNGHWMDIRSDWLAESEKNRMKECMYFPDIISPPCLQTEGRAKQPVAWIVVNVADDPDNANGGEAVVTLQDSQHRVVWQLAKKHGLPCQTVRCRTCSQFVVQCDSRERCQRILDDLYIARCSVYVYSVDPVILQHARLRMCASDVVDKEYSS